MEKEEFIQKLIDFKAEIQNCNNEVELRKIQERLKRNLLEYYNENDTFIRRCSMPPRGIKRIN